jgi:replicative DNA helicase
MPTARRKVETKSEEDDWAAPIADVGAERGLVQCLLTWPQAIDRLPNSFRPHFAFDAANRAALDEIFSLHRDGKQADVVLLLSRLKERSVFRDGGVTEYLAEVAQPGPLPINAPDYAATIERLAHKRHLARLTADASLHFQNGADPHEALVDLQAELDSYGRSLGQQEQTAERLLDEVFESIVNRDVAASIDFGTWQCNLSKLPIRRSGVITVGGQAGSGKTAAMLQGLFDAMRLPHQENLRLLVLNVEMAPSMIIERQLARLAGVDATSIQRRTFHENQVASLEAAREELRPVLRRTKFATAPFTISRMLMQVQEFSPDLFLCDYLQRISVDGEKLDLRAQINRTMDALRLIASNDVAVVAISALNRPSGGGDWTKDSVSLASFRESSEVEYSSDAVYALVRDRDSRAATMVALKNRSGPLEDIELEFEGPFQRFINPVPTGFPEFMDEQ